jgi:hypothetical protein
MFNLEENIDMIMRMNIFSNLDTGNQMVNMLISTMLMMVVPNLFNRVKNLSKIALQYGRNIIPYFRANTITIEGMRILTLGSWRPRTNNFFSMRFRALWHHLQKNKNKGIYGFKEFPNCESYYDDDDDDMQSEMNEKKLCDDIFVVDQSASFEFEEKSGIYCKVSIEQTERNNDDKKNVQGSQMETVKIQIYSYKKTMNELENYVNKITENYLDTLYESRRNTSFIYSLVDFSKYDNISKENTMPLWDECRFNSSRYFDTIFFEQKEQLINKLDFFENNREWYEREGHPYTLGIGLHGPPGTGKTSIIKCIANKLKRHLVVIPLSKIKTQRQFHQAFFENEYSHKNAKNPISFDKKIIVFEDIDCMADVIMERKRETTNEKTTSTKDELLKAIKNEFLKNNDSSSSLSSSTNATSEVPSLSSLMNATSATDATNDKITLSFILNVIDGIRETPGRIMIITSNHYDKIDKALVRPGRIDMTLEMKNASIQVIEQVIRHYYGVEIPRRVRSKLRDDVVSPAMLINLRFHSKNVDEYYENLLKLF